MLLQYLSDDLEIVKHLLEIAVVGQSLKKEEIVARSLNIACMVLRRIETVSKAVPVKED